MRVFVCCFLGLHFILLCSVQAQEVIQGDTLYRGLRINQSSASDIIRTLGQPRSRREMLAPFHVLFRGGGDGHGMRLYGYTFNYRNPRVQFVLDEGKIQLSEIHFGPKANVVTAKGIQPAKSTFGDVMKQYGAMDSDKPTLPPPRIQQRLMNWKNKARSRYTLLHYHGISFVSYGKWIREEDISQRRVDEIWLF